MSVQNFFDGLSEEVKAKLKDCKTDDEMMNVFADANIELDEDILELVNGGGLDDLLKPCLVRGEICPMRCAAYSTCPPRNLA